MILLTVALLGQVQSATLLQPPKIRHLRMLAQVHRVWDPSTGKPMGVVPFALANDFTPGIRDSATFAVELRDHITEAARERDATGPAIGQLFPGSPRMSGAFYAALPVKPAKWQVVAHEPGGRAEKKIDLQVAPLPEGPFVISDVMIGSERQGVAWQPGALPVSLAPKQIVLTDGSIQLNYQIRTISAHQSLRTSFLITRVVEESDQEGEVLKLVFPDERVVVGVNQIQREIDASRLPGSRYRLDVEVFAKDGTSLGKTTGMLELVR
jgi:hypothetical protein